MSKINFKGQVTANNMQVGDNNVQKIDTAVQLNKIRDILIEHVKKKATANEIEDYIDAINVLTDESKPIIERKQSGSKIWGICKEVIPLVISIVNGIKDFLPLINPVR
ncbi:MAG: hypothetical protein SGJ00_06540 [bacterium]|nr:hypothetical protein [bacterium]